MQIDHDALNEICSQIDLLGYAERTMDFRRKGDKYFCSCPKHSDSDPSLCISPDVNLFYCFSCHRGGNILQWMMEYEGLSFAQAVDKVSEMTGTEVKDIQISDTVKYFKELNRRAERLMQKPVDRLILPYEYYDTQFVRETPQEWVDEGISADVMREYDIRIDKSSNRICYPIYDNDDRLIGVKGRTRFKNFKELKIKKYTNYTSIKTQDFFPGMKQNRDEIKKMNSVYIFEGIKSGLKLATWGEPRNWLAAETSRLNDAQVRILIGMHIHEINIAFDRDVDLREIRACTHMLQRFTNVYVIRDRYNKSRLLPGDKDSPVDAGLDVWKQLVKERIRLGM